MQILSRLRPIPREAQYPPASVLVHKLERIDSSRDWIGRANQGEVIRAENVSYIIEDLSPATNLRFSTTGRSDIFNALIEVLDEFSDAQRLQFTTSVSGRW